MKHLGLALTLISGCADDGLWPERPIPVYYGDSLPEDCVEAMDGAIEFWAGHEVDFEVREPTPYFDYGVLVVYRDLPNGTIGQAALLAHDRVVIFIDLCARGGGGLQVAAHELGHALGLKHSTDPTNLMYPYITFINGSYNMALTADQLDQVR